MLLAPRCGEQVWQVGRASVPTGARVPLASHAGRGGDSPTPCDQDRLSLLWAELGPSASGTFCLGLAVLAVWLSVHQSGHFRGWRFGGEGLGILRCQHPS